jgi:hypothetical protein
VAFKHQASTNLTKYVKVRFVHFAAVSHQS